jgi:hypothetical protein
LAHSTADNVRKQLRKLIFRGAAISCVEVLMLLDQGKLISSADYVNAQKLRRFSEAKGLSAGQRDGRRPLV